MAKSPPPSGRYARRVPAFSLMTTRPLESGCSRVGGDGTAIRKPAERFAGPPQAHVSAVSRIDRKPIRGVAAARTGRRSIARTSSTPIARGSGATCCLRAAYSDATWARNFCKIGVDCSSDQPSDQRSTPCFLHKASSFRMWGPFSAISSGFIVGKSSSVISPRFH